MEKVMWFDTLKGIGEGKTESRKLVFLNSNFVKSVIPNSFLGLKKDEIVACDLKLNEHGTYFASLILKGVSKWEFMQ